MDTLIGEEVRIGLGQCIELYGAGEPYMPVLEALTRLAEEPDGARIMELLKELAPSWLAQMRHGSSPWSAHGCKRKGKV